MSIDNSTRSPFKLSPVKLLNNSWLDEVESSTAVFAMNVSTNATFSLEIKSEDRVYFITSL